jgi:DNA-directed RNA polymerase beta' subunit
MDTATKTSETGTYEHKMMKSFEDLTVGYDQTVRMTSNNMVIQFLYGNDGMDGGELERIHRASGDTISFIDITRAVDDVNASYGF